MPDLNRQSFFEFLGVGSNTYYSMKKTLQDYIHCNGSNRYGQVRQHARKITSMRPQRCEKCGYDKHVETCHIEPICSFSMDVSINVVNAESNLILLCPNCHWEHDNLQRKTTSKLLETCKCGKQKYRYSKQCLSCESDHRKKTTPRKVVNRPSKEELDHLVSILPMTKIGEKYGVSDNCIRKWIKSYNVKENGGPCQQSS
jgi:hypothetical protein